MRCAANNTKWRNNICSFSHFSIRHAARRWKVQTDKYLSENGVSPVNTVHVELIIFDYQINRIRTPIHHQIQAQSIESIFTHIFGCAARNSSRRSFIIKLSNRLIAASAEYLYDRAYESLRLAASPRTRSTNFRGKHEQTPSYRLIDWEQFFKLNVWRLAHWNFRKMCF